MGEVKQHISTGLLAHVGASRRAPHTNNESPVRKPGISYAEVSLHRGDMMDLRYWQPLKHFFDDLGERFVPELSCDNSGILCVLRDFHKKKVGCKDPAKSQKVSF